MDAGLRGTVTPGDLSQAEAVLLISRFHLGLLPGRFISRAEGWRWDWSQASEGALSQAEDEGALGQGGAVGKRPSPSAGGILCTTQRPSLGGTCGSVMSGATAWPAFVRPCVAALRHLTHSAGTEM